VYAPRRHHNDVCVAAVGHLQDGLMQGLTPGLVLGRVRVWVCRMVNR
jgi:hypothetical protein